MNYKKIALGTAAVGAAVAVTFYGGAAPYLNEVFGKKHDGTPQDLNITMDFTPNNDTPDNNYTQNIEYGTQFLEPDEPLQIHDNGEWFNTSEALQHYLKDEGCNFLSGNITAYETPSKYNILVPEGKTIEELNKKSMQDQIDKLTKGSDYNHDDVKKYSKHLKCFWIKTPNDRTIPADGIEHYENIEEFSASLLEKYTSNETTTINGTKIANDCIILSGEKDRDYSISFRIDGLYIEIAGDTPDEIREEVIDFMNYLSDSYRTEQNEKTDKTGNALSGNQEGGDQIESNAHLNAEMIRQLYYTGSDTDE